MKPLYRIIFKKNLSTKSASLQAKFIALLYGFVCLGVAFLAQFLGGVLQASLTIFGVVGGPLLGLFTLGMFTLTANEKGAVSGLTAGIIIAVWMAFGPKPPIPTLPTTTEGCGVIFSNITESVNIMASESEYLWLYRVSYLYNGVVGLLVTVIFGYLVSFVVRKISGRRITDESYDPNLFIPYLSKKLQKNKKYSLDLVDISKSNEELKRDINMYQK